MRTPARTPAIRASRYNVNVSSDQVRQVASADFPTRWGKFRIYGFRGEFGTPGSPRDEDAVALVMGMLIPAQVGMLPLFLLLKAMGLVNTVAGVMIPMMAPIFGIFMVRQYALGIPRDLLDAARMDGASEWRVFRKIVIPLLRPIMATLAIFIFLSSWNDFLWPLIVLSDDARYTLPVALANLSGEHVQDTELMMAGAVLTVLPVMVVFLVLQRQYVRGLMLGGVKG